MFRKPIIMRNYPHFLPADTAIWTNFLLQYPDYFELVDYDIHVGKGIEPDPSWSPEIRYMAITLTQRRIDVLAIRNNIYHIVEVKKDPGVSSVGQLLGYRILYEADYPDRPTPKLVLICNSLDRDLRLILDSLGISYFIVSS